MKAMKKIVAILAVALMLCSILPLSVFAADAETIKYTISNYPAGSQYKAETHELDEYLTVITNTRCHFTSELRIYAPSGSVNGEVILASTREMTAVVLNAGNKASTLTVSTSPDNSTWTQHSTLSVASSYKDLSISNLPAGTKYVKLVNGSGQVRVKYITVSYAADVAPEEPEVPACKHENAEYDFDCVAGYCPDCEETLPAKADHSYAEEITLNPTCTEAGEKALTCACGDEKTEVVPALGHDFSESDNCAVCGAEKPLNATITFDADKTQRTEYTTTVQKWENDGLTLINNKASSTTNVGDYSNPGRFYKSSTITISFPAMTSLVIDATGVGTDYLWDTTLNNAGLNFTVENKIYTITFAEPTDSITLTAANQARAAAITAYGTKKCEHEFDNNCDNECNLCGEANPDYADHVYAHEFDTTCDVCGAERAVVAPVIDVKLSISEDVNGLAFRFEADVAGFSILAGTFVQADYTNATYKGYKLIETGVTATNGVSKTTIKGERMCDLDENGKAMFAYRIINIPADKLATEITMTPYYIVEIDGVETTLYGEAVVGSYAAIAG